MANKVTRDVENPEGGDAFRAGPGLPSRQARAKLEQSALLQTMENICLAINARAGGTIVEHHRFLAPEPVVSSFIFLRNKTEYVMRVELHGASAPSLVFVKRTWRSTSRILNWFCPPVRFRLDIPQELVARQDIEKWFTYLLSGLSIRHRPRRRFARASLNGGADLGA